jgi:hypothetical protein
LLLINQLTPLICDISIRIFINLYNYFDGHYQLSKDYLKYMMFWKLDPFPSQAMVGEDSVWLSPSE